MTQKYRVSYMYEGMPFWLEIERGTAPSNGRLAHEIAKHRGWVIAVSLRDDRDDERFSTEAALVIKKGVTEITCRPV